MSSTAPTPKSLIAERGGERISALIAAGCELDALSESQTAGLGRALCASDFLFDAARRDPASVVPAHGDVEALIEREFKDLGVAVKAAPGVDDLMPLLRHARRRAMLAIALADLDGRASLGQTLSRLTRVADGLIAMATRRVYEILVQRWGRPRNAEGIEQPLVVLGMGKLGGGELNFSSDVDLILAFPEEGETDGARSCTNGEFFRRLGQRLIRVLDEVTHDGFVFRIDMRLRPHGEVGALAHSFAALEQYYQREGREWERYALIKARPLTDDGGAGKELLRTLRPFVYRRYLDYSAIDSLREMKAKVVREVNRRGLEDNIKLGAGGIREIEFICQVFQLIRGGAERGLRERSTTATLDELESLELLPRETAGELRRAYGFLRTLENRIQMLADQQQHELPGDAMQRAQLLVAMNLDEWSELAQALGVHRRIVHQHFQAVFADREQTPDRSRHAAFAALWNGEMEDDAAIECLGEAGMQQPPRAFERLRGLRDGAALRALSAESHRRMDRLIPLLLEDLIRKGGRQSALERVLDLLSSIARRSAYVSLLYESAAARRRVVGLCGDSAWIAERVTAHPVLLDELLEHPRPAHRQQLEAEMDRRLSAVEDRGLEAEMDALRALQGAQKLRIAVAEISGAMNAGEASSGLSELAEVVLSRTLQLARRDLSQRHGLPRSRDQIIDFGIVGYGRLGSGEMAYESDLDLVFLHQDVDDDCMTDGARAIPARTFMMRLTQRLIHHLQVLTAAGRLYEVDVRLRPDGSAGMLVCPVSTYRKYQRRRAWTWERQSLVRAKLVAGGEALQREFEDIRNQALTHPPEQGLASDVAGMRRRLRDQFGGPEHDIKRAPGGLRDLEFTLQFAVLRWSSEYPALIRRRKAIGLLAALNEAGLIDEDTQQQVALACARLNALDHRATLSGVVPRPDETAADRATISAFYQALLGEPPPGLQ